VLRATAFEAIIVVIAAEALARGEPQSKEERQRAGLAAQRLAAAVEVALPPPDRRDQYREARLIAQREIPDEAAA
jgi:hypothetical protein